MGHSLKKKWQCQFFIINRDNNAKHFLLTLCHLLTFRDTVRLHQGGVWFLTRLKTTSCYEVVRETRASGPVLADQVIRLSSRHGQAHYPELLRRVHYRDPETGKEYVFLTNRLDLPAWRVAELYRRRWKVEFFFKWIKQNLKIKAFYGTSRNAVLIQIWTALIAYLLLVWLKFKSKVDWSLLEFIRLTQTMLLERCHSGLYCARDHQTQAILYYSISLPDT